MNKPRTSRPKKRVATTAYDRTVKFKDCISKVTFESLDRASPEQKIIIRAILEYGER